MDESARDKKKKGALEATLKVKFYKLSVTRCFKLKEDR